MQTVLIEMEEQEAPFFKELFIRMRVNVTWLEEVSKNKVDEDVASGRGTLTGEYEKKTGYENFMDDNDYKPG